MDKELEKKQEEKRTEGLKTWLDGKPYWERFLWFRYLSNGVLDESDIEKCYHYLLEDNKLNQEIPGREEIVFSGLNFDNNETPKAKVVLSKIENLQDVNATDDQCAIEFGENLTIIYGDNGSGKSGIGRLLSNACLSRKTRRILPNVKTVSSGVVTKAKADFHLTTASGLQTINYSVDEVHELLKSFSVFDHECALIHLDSENEVGFVPSKLQIFDDIFKGISSLESKLLEDSKLRRKENPTEGVFIGNSGIVRFLSSISHLSTDKQIEDALLFTEDDKQLLSEKKALLLEKQKQDISRQKKELTDESNDLNIFKNTLFNKRSTLSALKASELNLLIKEVKSKREIAEKLSLKNFEFTSFKNIGSPEWRSLIAAAEKLYQKETISNEGVVPNYCLLCHQAVNNKEKTLFNQYWEFLKGTAETELSTAKDNLANYLVNLEKTFSTWPSFSDTEIAVKILKKDSVSEIVKLKTAFDDLGIQLLSWIENARNEQEIVFADTKIDLDFISALVTQKKEAGSKLVDPTQEIKTVSEEVAYLQHKQQASGLLLKIKEYVAWLRWQKAASMINLSSVRGNITRKKTEIMSELVISEYVNIFNEETQKLDCNFGLKVGSRGCDAKTVKELKLDFAQGHNPSDILSEGEQTVSALADFLTEARINKNNSGIVFDDPVNSLDHLRKTIIARRLVDEAQVRQVIVLTHDISFLLDLQTFSDASSVVYAPVSIRKNGDRIGVIKQELPWFAQTIKSRVGILKNELPILKKLEDGDQDIYRKEVKGWYELLREAWERAIEERLFNGVVQRFKHAIQTQKLNKISVTPELIKEVNDGMTESSKWLHDMSSGINPAIPKNAKLAGDLKLLEDLIEKCNYN